MIQQKYLQYAIVGGWLWITTSVKTIVTAVTTVSLTNYKSKPYKKLAIKTFNPTNYRIGRYCVEHYR